MNLERRPSKDILCSQTQTAQTFKQRLLGLIGTKSLDSSALYIPSCNWIHTCFMSYAIDVIYLDKKMKICKMDHNLKPWRLGRPVFSARSVVEMPAGSAQKLNLQIGEELHVGD